MVISALANAQRRSESANSEYRAVMMGERCPMARIKAACRGQPAVKPP